MKLRNPKTRNPFEGYPQTIALRDKSNKLEGFRIYARHSTPLLAKLADGAAVVTTVGLMFVGVDIVTQIYPDGLGEVLLTVAGAAASHPAIKLGWRWLVRKTTVIEVRRDVVRINGLLGWKSHNRDQPHAFALPPHDKAEDEREKLDLKARKLAQKGKLKIFPKYYQKSGHLMLLLNGEPKYIAAVFGPKDGNAIRARLSACVSVLDGLQGKGPALSPEDQYRNGPGSIPLED